LRFLPSLDGNPPVIAAVDMGTSKVCTLVGQPRSGAIEILGIGMSASQGIRKGRVVNIERATYAVRESMSLAMEVAKREPNIVCVAVAGDYITSINLENEVILSRGGREITKREVDKVVEGTRAQSSTGETRVLHLIPQEFSVDDQHGIADPVGMIGSALRARVHLVTAQETQIMNLGKCFQQVGIEIAALAFQPYVAALSVLTPAEKEAGVLLVDLGGGTTDMAMFYEGSIWYSGIIPLGGEHITSDLAVGLRTSREEAEKIKLRYGSAFSKYIEPEEIIEVKDMGMSSLHTVRRKFVCEVIEARVREILAILRGELRSTGLGRFLRGGIVLTGGSSQLEGLADFASTALKVPVRLGSPESQNYVGMVQTIASPVFSTVCGLLDYAVSGTGRERFRYHHPVGPAGKGQKMINWLRDFFMMG